VSLLLALQGGGGPVTITADLAATEAPDVAAFSVTLVRVADLAATEAPDVLAFAATLIPAVKTITADLAATEAKDVAAFSATLESAQADIDRGARRIKKAAKEQRYIYRRERIQQKVSQPVAEAIERVLEHFEEIVTPTLGQAAALLALELEERGVAAAQGYTDLLREELSRLQQEDDDDEIHAVLVELMR
jgi:hypothetical protein